MTERTRRRQHTYESATARIEEIIRRLDSGEAGLRETLDLCNEGRELVEFCAGELDAVGQGLEELRLDELVARLEQRPTRHEPSASAIARPAAAHRGLRARAPAARRVQRLHAPCRRTSALHGGGEEGIGEDVTYDAEDQDALQAAGPVQPLAGEWTLDVVLRPRRDARPWPRPAAREASRALPPLGLRVGGAGPRAAPGGHVAARRAGARAAAGDLRRLAAARRAADASSRSSRAWRATRR